VEVFDELLKFIHLNHNRTKRSRAHEQSATNKNRNYCQKCTRQQFIFNACKPENFVKNIPASNAHRQRTKAIYAKDFVNNNASTAYVSFYFLIHFVNNNASTAYVSFYFLIHFVNNIASTAYVSFYFLIHFVNNKSANNARKQPQQLFYFF
jgi:hypothetical protein